MPSKKNKKALKAFGKNGRELKKKETQYDTKGNWISHQGSKNTNNENHHDKMRKTKNEIFDRYYGELQNMNAVIAAGKEVKVGGPHREEAERGADAAGGERNFWHDEVELFKTDLPITFWLNPTDPLSETVKLYLISLYKEQQYFNREQEDNNKNNNNNNNNNNKLRVLEPIEWYPYPFYAWRVLASKTQMRARQLDLLSQNNNNNNNRTEDEMHDGQTNVDEAVNAPDDTTELQKMKVSLLQRLRAILQKQTQLGTISRQEEVSMLPVFFLNINNNHHDYTSNNNNNINKPSTDICLDMCSSPGSKTAQMVVELGASLQNCSRPDSQHQPMFPFNYTQQQQQQQKLVEGGGNQNNKGEIQKEGIVIANEMDTKRANMLVHQIKRLTLLFPFVCFTNHDAQYYPDIHIHPRSHDLFFDGGATTPPAAAITHPDHHHHHHHHHDEQQNKILKFDKILCDVVCSGDGTLRKAPHIFKCWTPREGMNLQKIQIKILLRAAHLLAVTPRNDFYHYHPLSNSHGDSCKYKREVNKNYQLREDAKIIVYSTCSLNPIENEAVVYYVMKKTKGALRLINVQKEMRDNNNTGDHFSKVKFMLQHLKTTPGMRSWTVTDAKNVVVEKEDEHMHEALFPPPYVHGGDDGANPEIDVEQVKAHYQKRQEQLKNKNSSHNTDTDENEDKEVDFHYLKELDLANCLRFFPSHCNGGGFFIAVFEKVSPFELPHFNNAAAGAEDGETKNNNNNNNNKDKKNKNKKNKVEEVAATGTTTTATNEDAKGQEAETEENNSKEAENDNTNNSAEKVEKKLVLPPFYLPAPTPIHETLQSFYHIPLQEDGATTTNKNEIHNKNQEDDGEYKFPGRQLFLRAPHNAMTASLTSSSTIYFVSAMVRKILLNNYYHMVDFYEPLVNASNDNNNISNNNNNNNGISKHLTIVSAGLRFFAFENLKKNWRLANESALLLSSFMKQNYYRYVNHNRTSIMDSMDDSSWTALTTFRFVPVSVSIIQQLIRQGGKLKDTLISEISENEEVISENNDSNDHAHHHLRGLNSKLKLKTFMEHCDIGTVVFEIHLNDEHLQNLFPAPVFLHHHAEVSDNNNHTNRSDADFKDMQARLAQLSAAAKKAPLYAVGLRARQKLQLSVDHEDVDGLLMRLGVETVFSHARHQQVVEPEVTPGDKE